ncbi:MAG: YcbK family protein [Deltaproteobacteria bacterium]|nr:YcbK family protein [Deltaproteobacteria bacterium]
MRPIQSILILLILSFAVTGTASSENITDVSRYFYNGDGKLNLVSAKNGITFNGRYRVSEGIYDEKVLKTIHRLFGAEKDRPLSTISLRLIEFLDYLEDNLHPGARITIVSGWRSPQYNTDLRNKGRLAAKASLHQYGMAADIKIQGISSKRVWNTVKKLGFGGTGYYQGKLVHIDVGPARSWDEKTSGVGTDISTQNKLVGLVTEYDIYLPGERVDLRFIRMTAFPIGVTPEFVMEKVEKDGQSKEIARFEPSFAIADRSQCPQFFDIGRMTGIRWKLPSDISSGRYKIRASFCQRLWEDMPTRVYTPEFDVIRR